MTDRAFQCVMLTGEYPPQIGGVGDYTHQVAHWLYDHGVEVKIICPHSVSSDDPLVVRLPDHYSWRGLLRLHTLLMKSPTRTVVFVQYVPHMYGWKGMNLLFALWLWLLAPRPVWVMFHEIAYPFERGQSIRRRILATVQHLMARLVARSANRVFVSIQAWLGMLGRYCKREVRPAWLPVPSNLPAGGMSPDPDLKRQFQADANDRIVGHFGTYGEQIASFLLPVLHACSRMDGIVILLVGKGSSHFRERLIDRHSVPANRVHAVDSLGIEMIGPYLLCCDVCVQPYPDGLSTRRGSLMANLAMGRPVVSNVGPLSERFWNSSNSVHIEAYDPERFALAALRLTRDDARRHTLSTVARTVYEERFSLSVLGQRLLQGLADDS